ncbi:MAG: adenine phosphoribosyltransferase [Clostridiales bacterium]|jgi:adenine phosphoribosyltransferase|nr:adenine phosphoribosyltransferase [Clostridiales bacterium]
MADTYTIDICGRKVELPLLAISPDVTIAFFNLHGNRELTDYCGLKLAEKIIPLEAEVLITAESKGLQLTHVIAGRLGHAYYAVARKSKKLYMQDGISAEVKSITTKEKQTFYLSAHDVSLIRNKRVAIVDDVVSTGGSLAALELLVARAGGRVAVKAAVLAEGEAAARADLTYLAALPLFH